MGLFRVFYVSASTESINDYTDASWSCDSECGRSDLSTEILHIFLSSTKKIYF